MIHPFHAILTITGSTLIQSLPGRKDTNINFDLIIDVGGKKKNFTFT